MVEAMGFEPMSILKKPLSTTCVFPGFCLDIQEQDSSKPQRSLLGCSTTLTNLKQLFRLLNNLGLTNEQTILDIS